MGKLKRRRREMRTRMKISLKREKKCLRCENGTSEREIREEERRACDTVIQIFESIHFQ
jgi:hypothetical protein